MQVTLSYAYKINSPEDWKSRMAFYFNKVEKMEVSDYNKFGNQEVIITSSESPLITYWEGDSLKCRHTTEEEIKDYCQIEEGKFIFSQVQKNCIDLGRGIWD